MEGILAADILGRPAVGDTLVAKYEIKVNLLKIGTSSSKDKPALEVPHMNDAAGEGMIVLEEGNPGHLAVAGKGCY